MSSKHAPKSILAVDIGGSKVKVLLSGETEQRRAATGPGFTPARLVESVKELAKGWNYDVISLGYPGQSGRHGPTSEPGNLGPGWVGFDFEAAFEKPVRILNDAAMQALGCYERGRMLFIGLGTGVGSAMISENVVFPLELGRIRSRNGRRLWRVIGEQGRRKLGNRLWRQEVFRTVADLQLAFEVDDFVIGGGNAKLFKEPPPGARLGSNLAAFRGGFRLWQIEELTTDHDNNGKPVKVQPPPAEWRLV